MAKALSEGVTETTGPTFELLPKVKRAEEQLFGVWVAPDSVIREIVSLLPLAKDTKALLSGPPGAGKTVLIIGISTIYFGPESIAIVQCDPSLTPDDVLYRLDLAKLVKGEAEEISPRAIIGAPFKWWNEITRANTVLQDAILGLLSEKEVVYRDKHFKSPSYVSVADFNPADLGGSQELSWPVADRFDLLVEIPTLSLLKRVSLTLSKYQGKHLKDLRGSYSNVLTSEEMQSVWDDVEKVTVPQPVSVLTEMLMEAITGCVYDRSRVSTLYKEKCSVGRCSFWNEVCSKIERPASFRATDALVSLGKARAWREKRTEISVDDILFLFPYVLAHRAKVKAQFLLPYSGDTLAFYKKEVNDTYEAKAEVWKRAMGYFYEAFRGNKDAISKIRDMADRDLAVKGLFANFEEHIVEILNELASSKGAFTGKELAEAEEYLKLLSAEKQGVYSPKLAELREKLTLTVDRDSYLRLVLPKLAEMEPNAASVVSGEYHGKKFDADISTDDVRLSFTDSETAERVRRIANNKKEVKPES